MKKFISILFISIFILGCKPDQFKAELYTTDIALALDGEVVETPVLVSFSLLGEDNQGIFDAVVGISKKYLDVESKFSKSNTMLGEQLVIETKLPMGTSTALETYLKKNKRVGAFLIDKGSSTHEVSFHLTEYSQMLSSEINNINIMISLGWPPESFTLRVSSDSKDPVDVFATAVFVAKKPYLNYSKTLKRRDFVEIEFSGKSGSVYSELPPRIFIEN